MSQATNATTNATTNRTTNGTTRRARLLALPLVLGACAADGADDAADDGVALIVRGEGFAAGDVRISVTQPATPEPVACAAGAVAGGAFELPLDATLAPGVAYRVDGFVDLDGDARCEFGVDAVMSIDLSPLAADASFTFTDGASRVGDEPRGCAAFGGLSYRVELASATLGLVRYALVRLDAEGVEIDRVVARGHAVVDEALGRAVIDLEGAAQAGHFYRIELFEADSVDAPCDDELEVWRISTGRLEELGPVTCTGVAEPTTFADDLVAPVSLEAGSCAGFGP